MPIPDVLCAALPGAAGGFAWFLCGVKRGRLRNDKYVRKAIVEAAGGLLVASCVAWPLSPMFAGSTPVVVLSFAIGTSWSGVQTS